MSIDSGTLDSLSQNPGMMLQFSNWTDRWYLHDNGIFIFHWNLHAFISSFMMDIRRLYFQIMINKLYITGQGIPCNWFNMLAFQWPLVSSYHHYGLHPHHTFLTISIWTCHHHHHQARSWNPGHSGCLGSYAHSHGSSSSHIVIWSSSSSSKSTQDLVLVHWQQW